ncbi:MAG: TraM recognition domain-containing protein [Bdellovibrionales bacterium]|nr:TraM recognition domain-containing protein [Bdellovibrionales bacterium]
MSAQKSETGKSSSLSGDDRLFAVGIAALIASALGYKLEASWRRVFFAYYEEIHFAIYLLFAALCGLALFWFHRKTRNLSKSVEKLSPYWSSYAGIPVGRTTESGVDLYLPESIRLGHVQILGSTGRGKTESVILPWLVRDALRGYSPILIDGKGDPELVDRIRAALREAQAPHTVEVFDLGNPDSSSTTNPLANGSAQQITDRIFTSFDFEDPYYRGVQYSHAGSIVALLRSTAPNEAVTFSRLHELLTAPQALGDAIAQVSLQSPSVGVRRLLQMDPKLREKELSGLISQIQPFANGEIAKLVNGAVEGKSHRTPSELILNTDRKPRVLVFLLPTLKYQSIGRQLGRCLLQEIAWAVGERSSLGQSHPFVPVYLDEFSAFVYPGFQNVLNKARSAGVAFHLSHQSTGDLALVDPNFATILNTNTNVKCLLGLNDPDTADFFAKHLGTYTSEKLTERAKSSGFFGRERTGDVSIRAVEEYRIHPNRLKNYTAGRGVIHFPTPNGNVTEEIQFAALRASELRSFGKENER